MKRTFLKVLGDAQWSIFRVNFSPVNKNVAVSSGLYWKRTITISPILVKNFKYKPIPPKFKLHTPEELFGEPKGWNISPGGFLLLVSAALLRCPKRSGRFYIILKWLAFTDYTSVNTPARNMASLSVAMEVGGNWWDGEESSRPSLRIPFCQVSFSSFLGKTERSFIIILIFQFRVFKWVGVSKS
jgi:hypothetical protein